MVWIYLFVMWVAKTSGIDKVKNPRFLLPAKTQCIMNEELHIGKMIKSKMKEEGRKAKWLADKIACETSVIYRIYKRRFPETERLFKICTHLKMNVYIHYFDHVNALIRKEHNL